VIAQLKDQGFICFDETRFESIEQGLYTLTGRIGCRGRLIVTVEKFLEAVGPPQDGSPIIQAFKYAYNVSIQGYGNLVRFDNAHAHPGQPDEHHRHDFDPFSGEELPKSPQWVGREGWPNLGVLLRALSDWYYDNCNELPHGFEEASPSQ
jgi:hypothetical protein